MYLHLQRTNIPLQGLDRRALRAGAILGPHSQIEEKYSGKADQSTLASGGSEHA